MLLRKRITTMTAVATVSVALVGGAAAAATSHVQGRIKVSGAVTSVNGMTSTGTCGTSASAGSFGLTSDGTDYGVTVDPTLTTFKDRGARGPSFADVCVGEVVHTVDTISTGVLLTAIAVTVVPPHSQRVSGTVTTVNGMSNSGTCATADTSGSFGLASGSADYTVDVATTTAFKERGVSSPSFADVCIGDRAQAVGPLTTSGVVTAVKVSVTPPHVPVISGAVTSVDGISSAGTCGTAATVGDFTLTSGTTAYTVDVGTSTTFKERDATSPSFANVCVGVAVKSLGALSGGDLQTATTVTVVPPHPHKISGTVTLVEDMTSAGSCGIAQTAGEFTLTSGTTPYTVEVGTNTTFKERGVSSPSFANVCVGGRVRALGPVSADDTVSATNVKVIPPPHRKVSGTVVAVNGVSTANTCGVAGTAGTFTVTTQSTPYTVDVGPTSTVFKEQGVSAPSFQIVCVGARTHVVGTLSQSTAVTATEVVVSKPGSKTTVSDKNRT